MLGWIFAVLMVLLVGCAQKAEKPTEPTTHSVKQSAEKPTPPALAGADQALKDGSFDDAAAQLLQLRNSGHQFSDREATAYRRALNEAYTRALEAAEKGDPRAEAAIKMIRAAGAN